MMEISKALKGLLVLSLMLRTTRRKQLFHLLSIPLDLLLFWSSLAPLIFFSLSISIQPVLLFSSTHPLSVWYGGSLKDKVLPCPYCLSSAQGDSSLLHATARNRPWWTPMPCGYEHGDGHLLPEEKADWTRLRLAFLLGRTGGTRSSRSCFTSLGTEEIPGFFFFWGGVGIFSYCPQIQMRNHHPATKPQLLPLQEEIGNPQYHQ